MMKFSQALFLTTTFAKIEKFHFSIECSSKISKFFSSVGFFVETREESMHVFNFFENLRK